MASPLDRARKLAWILLKSLLRFTFMFVNNCVAIPSYCLYLIVLQPVRVLDAHTFWYIEGVMFRWLLAMVASWGWCAGYTVTEWGDDVRPMSEDEAMVIVNHQATGDVCTLMMCLQDKGTVVRKMLWLMDHVFKYTNFGLVSLIHGDFFIRDLQLETCAGELSHVKRSPRLDNDSTSTAPRSTEASLSEEVFTESEDEPPQVRPSQTVLTISHAQPQPPQENATPDATSGSPGSHAAAPEGPAEDPDTPQDSCDTQEAESSSPANQIKAEEPHSTEPGRCRSHRFLCLRVGRAMRKTFLSHASASMQQYAQRDRKHEYWFAVPAERSDHLYAFFIQWTPDMYGEGLLGGGREPGFVVVKKNQSQTPDPESADQEKPSPDITFKDWEVVSVTEYYRRIDALNSEDLRSLCKRLQITTKEEVNSKLLLKSEPEPESFRPSLTQPSDLLQPDQIEKLAKHLPPRTIGYPWSLAFSTSQHGMSIKSLYRSMQELDSPVLMVIKDSEGQMFGALASEPLKVSDGFYGTGETFLFTFSPDLQVFKWTGDNLFFMKGDMDSVAFGGGGGEFGLWLDGDLYHGRTSSCKTFNSPMLSQTEDFYVQDIEIWAFE